MWDCRKGEISTTKPPKIECAEAVLALPKVCFVYANQAVASILTALIFPMIDFMHKVA
jgi:hypothetical protein